MLIFSPSLSSDFVILFRCSCDICGIINIPRECKCCMGIPDAARKVHYVHHEKLQCITQQGSVIVTYCYLLKFYYTIVQCFYRIVIANPHAVHSLTKTFYNYNVHVFLFKVRLYD